MTHKRSESALTRAVKSLRALTHTSKRSKSVPHAITEVRPKFPKNRRKAIDYGNERDLNIIGLK